MQIFDLLIFLPLFLVLVVAVVVMLMSEITNQIHSYFVITCNIKYDTSLDGPLNILVFRSTGTNKLIECNLTSMQTR